MVDAPQEAAGKVDDGVIVDACCPTRHHVGLFGVARSSEQREQGLDLRFELADSGVAGGELIVAPRDDELADALHEIVEGRIGWFGVGGLRGRRQRVFRGLEYQTTVGVGFAHGRLRGNYSSNAIGVVSGDSFAFESLEPGFHQDLNHDGQIGAPTTVIEANGSTQLTEVGDHFFLYDSGGSGPSLKIAGADVVAGQFGAWAPISAEQTASGYEVAWKVTGADQYTVWNTDHSGNYSSNAIGVVSGTSYALESLEPGFHHDLNHDGQIGAPTINDFFLV
jgi:hypothetical protein